MSWTDWEPWAGMGTGLQTWFLSRSMREVGPGGRGVVAWGLQSREPVPEGSDTSVFLQFGFPPERKVPWFPVLHADWKTSNLSMICKRGEDRGQTTAPKIRETHRETLLRDQCTGRKTRWWTDGWRLTTENSGLHIPRDQPRGGTTILWNLSPGSQLVLMWVSLESLLCFWRQEGKRNHFETHQHLCSYGLPLRWNSSTGA